MKIHGRYLFILVLLLGVMVASAQDTTPSPMITDMPTATTTPDPNDADGDGVPNANDRCGALTGATDVDANGCPKEFDPYAGLMFDHEPHELWYGRFWTGSCRGVPGFCLGGDPAWFDVTDELVAQFPDDEQGVLRNRLWAAGRTIGHEWASDPDLNDKQIFTRDLRQWGRQLERADDVLATLTEIENEVCERLGANALAGGYSDAETCQPEPTEPDSDSE